MCALFIRKLVHMDI